MFPLWAWWGENTSASLRRITDSWFFICKNLPSRSLCLGEAPAAEAPAAEARVLGAGWSVRCPTAGPGKSHVLLCPYSAITGSPVGGDSPPRHTVHTTQALRGPHWGGRWALGKMKQTGEGGLNRAGLTLAPKAGLTCWHYSGLQAGRAGSLGGLAKGPWSWADNQIISGPVILGLLLPEFAEKEKNREPGPCHWGQENGSLGRPGYYLRVMCLQRVELGYKPKTEVQAPLCGLSDTGLRYSLDVYWINVFMTEVALCKKTNKQKYKRKHQT